MRKPLAEYKKEMSLRDTLRTLKGQIESILWQLRNMNTSAAAGTGSSSSFSVETVETLPPIPEDGYQMVFWTSLGAGVGDDQTWEAFAGQARWYPCQRPTTLSGAPGV